MADSANTASAAATRKRRRLVISCLECHRRKQKCDRGEPCGNCVARGVGDYCAYETEPKSVNTHSSTGSDAGTTTSPNSGAPGEEKPVSDDMMYEIQNFGYAWTNPLNSLGVLKKALEVSCAGTTYDQDPVATPNHMNSLNIQYRGYVRRIPPKPYCERLIENFFSAVNWQYYAIEEVTFRAQLHEWWNTAYIVLNRGGPADLAFEMQYFPALLFQVLALSLQFLPPRYDSMIEDLKFGAGQSFSDLSSEYSDCGVAIVTLLGRYRPTLPCVQQEFLRASWLKNMGRVVESWHTIGLAVKEAQEIGLHKEPAPPKTTDIKQTNALLWKHEVRKRIWINLVLWDLHMSLILGRPMSIHLSDCTVSQPLNIEFPADITEKPPMPQDLSRPTPLVQRLIDYKIGMLLPEIRSLEIEGSLAWDDPRIDTMHQTLVRIYNDIPAYLRHKDPDTQWDERCPFLPAQREIILGTVQMTLLALNRLYIFKSQRSRRIVLRAALESLDSQKRLFQVFDAQHYKLYTLSFNTFDAAILLSVVLLSFPLRSPELFDRCIQTLKDAHGRLRFLGEFITLAKTGANVIETLVEKIQAVRRSSSSAGNFDSPNLAREAISLQKQDYIAESPRFEPGNGEMQDDQSGNTAQGRETTRAWLEQTSVPGLTPSQDLLQMNYLDVNGTDWYDLNMPCTSDEGNDGTSGSYLARESSGSVLSSSKADGPYHIMGEFEIPLPLRDLTDGDLSFPLFGNEQQQFDDGGLPLAVDPALLKSGDIQPFTLQGQVQNGQPLGEEREREVNARLENAAREQGEATMLTSTTVSQLPTSNSFEDNSFWTFLNNIPTPNPTHELGIPDN